MRNYGKLTAGILACWFIFALAASALHLSKKDSNRVGLAAAFPALTPIVASFLWFAASEKFRQFAQSLSPGILTFVQSWRILGITFVMLQAYGVLPTIFALPAGYGDITIGATAPFVAWSLSNPTNRRSFIHYQFLGMSAL